MSEEEYQQRLKKIKEDEKEGKISSSQARSRIWLLDLEKEEADQELKKKKNKNDDDFENDQNNDDNSDEESEEDSEDEDSEDDSEDNDSEDNSEEDDSDEDSKDEDSEDKDSEDKDSDNDESKEENSEDKDSDKDDNQNDEENNKKDDNQNDNDKKDSEDKGKNDEDSLKNNKDNDSTSKSKSDSTNANSNKAPQDDIPSKRNINNQGVNTSNASGAQAGSNAGTSAAGTSGAGSASAGAGAGGASAGSAAGAAGGASAGAGGAAGGASAAGGGASSLGPALGYVLLFIAVVIIMIGILFFFIGMPGLVIGKIGNAILNMRQNIEILFDGNNAANIMVDRKDVTDAATYLMQMGYDLGGYGFLDDEVKQKIVGKSTNWPWRKISDWWTSADYSDSSGLKYNLYNSDYNTWDIVTNPGKWAQYMGCDPEETANLYLSKKFTGGELINLNPTDINREILLAVNSDAEVIFCKSKYLGMYLTADNATYLLRNNNTEVGNRLLKLFGANDTEDGSGLIHFWNASNINANKYIEGINGQVKLANSEGFAGYDRVAVLRSQRLLKIKNANDGGWFFKQTYYTYDLNYITKYGFPLQLALALHLSTMAPDFAYTVAERAAYDTKVNLALLRTDDNDISMSIKLDFDNDGIKETYEVQQKTMVKVHRTSSHGNEEDGYTLAELNDLYDELLIDGETREDFDKEILELEGSQIVETPEEALVTLEEALKLEAEKFEINKIPITYYYQCLYDNAFNIDQGTYNEAIYDSRMPLDSYVKNADDAGESLRKIIGYLIEYEYADYKKDDNQNIVGIIIKEEYKENENVKKIKELFTTYFRNSYFSEYFKEDKIQLGKTIINKAIPKELRDTTLDQAMQGINKDWINTIETIDYDGMEDNFRYTVFEEVLNSSERIEQLRKEWEPMICSGGTMGYSYYGRPVFMSICDVQGDIDSISTKPVLVIEDSEEDDDIADNAVDEGCYKDKILFYYYHGTFFGYEKASIDEIWEHFIMGEDLQIKDISKASYWPWRKYYRLVDEEGNPVIFENENNVGHDFLYVNADSYYADEEDPKGWFWRNAIPKKIAYAILNSVYGYNEEEAENAYIKDLSLAEDILIMLKNILEVNTEGYTKYLPFIASVTDHWYEDLDFSGCYEWVQTDTPITDRYPYEAEINDSKLVKDAADKELLTVIETVPGTLKQKAEPKVSGVSGEWIRNLIDNQKYYIYDGTGKSEEEKSIAFTDVAIDVIAMLEQINGEESQHIIRIFKELLASYNIVFEESQNTTLKKKLFCNVIATYNDENNLYTEGDNCVFYAKTAIKRKGFQMGLDVMAPIDARVVYRSADSIALELIAPGTSYDDYIILITGFEVSENINLDDEITKGTVIGKTIKQDLKFILRDQNGAIVKNSYTMLSGTNFENFAKIFDEKSYKLVSEEASYVYKSSENDVQGFKEEEKLFIPIAGTITEKTDSSITIKNNLETHKQGEAYTDYTVTISGIKVDSSLYVGQTVSRENELGTTTKQDIVIVLKDENQNTITEN